MFIDLVSKWRCGYPDGRGQKSLGYASPELRLGTKHALILEHEILSIIGAFEVSIRVFGEKSSLAVVLFHQVLSGI